MNKNGMIAVVIVVLVIVGGALWYKQSQEMMVAQVPIVTTPETTTPAGLEGTTWVWVETMSADGIKTQPAQSDAFTLSFNAESRVSGTTDCNSVMGNYTADASVLTLGQLASTKMFCNDSQEQLFTSALAQVESYSADSMGNLVLGLKDGGQMTLHKQ